MTIRRTIPPERSTCPGTFAMVEGHEFEEFHGAASRLGGRGDIEVAGEDEEVLKDRQFGIEVVLLLADADPGLDRAGLPRDVQAEDAERSGRERREAVDHPDRGGLSRPVGTEDPEALAGVYRKGEVVHRDKVSEGFAEMVRCNDRAHPGTASVSLRTGIA